MSSRRAGEIEAVYGKVAEGLECLVHQALCLSMAYPAELFKSTVFGSYVYSRSRHPELNEYIHVLGLSLKKLLIKDNLTAFAVRIMDGREVVADWIFEVAVSNITSWDSGLFTDWIGSTCIKMGTKASRIPKALDEAERTFSLVATLKSSMSMYVIGGEASDWIIADSHDASNCTIHAVKSFFNTNMTLNSYLKAYPPQL